MGEVDDDARFRAWLRGHLAHAAADFGVTLTGDPLYGWRLRSISAAAVDPSGRRRWLRVGTERHSDLEHAGPMWTGLRDANLIRGVPKPDVVTCREWDVPERGRAVRADLMTWVDGRACAAEEIVRAPLRLPSRWWADLRNALDALRAVPTNRWAKSGGHGDRRVRAVFGDHVASRVGSVIRRETGHGDLHWANLVGPTLSVLDWEMWGLVPAGADAATLYCRSLLVPDTARQVRAVLGDLLDTPDGRIAQVHAAASLIARGEWPELEGPLRRHVHTLMTEAA